MLFNFSGDEEALLAHARISSSASNEVREQIYADAGNPKSRIIIDDISAARDAVVSAFESQAAKTAQAAQAATARLTQNDRSAQSDQGDVAEESPKEANDVAKTESQDQTTNRATGLSALRDAWGTNAQTDSQNFFTRGISSIMSRISSAQERHEAIAKIKAGKQPGLLTEQLVAQVAGNEAFATMVESNLPEYQRMMSYYRCAMMEVETKLRVLNEELGLQHDRNPIESIKCRLKSPDSLALKMYRRGYPMTLESIEENIDDIAGVRVVCTFLEDMYSLAEALLQQDDIKLIECNDYIKNPKPSGYRSLHLNLIVPIFLEHEKRDMKVELQFRTISQNFWATLEHQLRYKKDLPEDDAAYVAQELTDLAETAASLDIRMQALRNYLDEE